MRGMFQVSPSLEAGCQLDLASTLESVRGLEHIHLDVDDGNFVRGITFGMGTVGLVARNTAIPIDVHLEVLNPLEYLDPLGESGVAAACAQVETLLSPSAWLSGLKARGIGKRGLAINLKTPVDEVLSYADQLEYILFVSVEADCEGLPFRPMTLEKLRRARSVVGTDIELWVDGGINAGNLRDVVEAGADGVVVGRAVFGAEDPKVAAEEIKRLGESLRGGA